MTNASAVTYGREEHVGPLDRLSDVRESSPADILSGASDLCGNHISLAAGQVRRLDKLMQAMQHIEYHAVTVLAINGLRVSYSAKSTLFGFLYGTI